MPYGTGPWVSEHPASGHRWRRPQSQDGNIMMFGGKKWKCLLFAFSTGTDLLPYSILLWREVDQQKIRKIFRGSSKQQHMKITITDLNALLSLLIPGQQDSIKPSEFARFRLENGYKRIDIFILSFVPWMMTFCTIPFVYTEQVTYKMGIGNAKWL